jgi:prevent-host-death family protein
MINLQNILPLTDFRRNASSYVEQVRETRSPLVLTVNGEAAVIVQDALSFQQLLDRLESVEKELQAMKLDTFQKAVMAGIEQLEAGDYEEYDEDTLPELFASVKANGRQRLADCETV